MRLLVLDHHDSFVHNILQLLHQARGVQWDCIQTEDFDLQQLGSYDGVILSPGPGVPADYPGDQLLLDRVVAGRLPLLGVCLGHQTIGEYFGAQLYKLPAPLHGHPSQLEAIDLTDAVVGSQAPGATVGRYHSWAIEAASLPDCLQATSYSDEPTEGRVIMSIRHRSLPIWGVQFHPESMITTAGYRYLQGFLSTIQS